MKGFRTAILEKLSLRRVLTAALFAAALISEVKKMCFDNSNCSCIWLIVILLLLFCCCGNGNSRGCSCGGDSCCSC